MDILQKIMAERRQSLAGIEVETPRSVLEAEAAGRVQHSLCDRLADKRCVHIIAEVKKASPSAGLLRPDYFPADIAGRYEGAGACGISVLTEPRHFLGSEKHLRAVRKAVNIPVLRKDFMCDVYQVHEAAAWGADVILLIMAALDDGEARELYEVALGLGLEVLAEAHTAEEVARALRLEQAIVGVNSRNLKTLKTDLAVAHKLAESIPVERLSVAESGIKTRADIEDLRDSGYDGFLIGEVLMANESPADKLKQLLEGEA